VGRHRCITLERFCLDYNLTLSFSSKDRVMKLLLPTTDNRQPPTTDNRQPDNQQ
jgi:hypothetical protein